MPTQYFMVDSGRLSFAEYWRMSPNILVFSIAAIAKLFGGLPMTFSIPLVDRLHTLPFEFLPTPAREALAGPIAELESERFTLQFCLKLPVLEADRLACGAVLLSADGLTWSQLSFAQDPNFTQVALSCISKFQDGTLRRVTTEKKQLQPHPDHVIIRCPGASAKEIYETHLQYLRQWETEEIPIRLTPQAVREEILDLERKAIEFHVQRGVFVPMPPELIEELKESASHYRPDDE